MAAMNEPSAGSGSAAGITVVLADDHAIWRRGVMADLTAPFRVIGEAGTAPEAVEIIQRLKPALVVSDLHMPGGGGIHVAKMCGELCNVVMLTVSESERDLLDAVAAGAKGYLVKSTPPEELRSSLLKAAKGEPVFSSSDGWPRDRGERTHYPIGNVKSYSS